MAVRTRHLNLYLDGTYIGQVEQTPQGSLRFAYDEAYRVSPGATPLSLSMPLSEPAHSNRRIDNYLEGLLPDSDPARERWAKQYQVSARNAFALLGHIGLDAAGAVQAVPPGVAATEALSRRGDVEWLSDDDFQAIVRDLAEHGAEWDPGRFGGKWSLAGAQPKIALFRDPQSGRYGIPRDSTPTTHIIKPVIKGFEQHHVNETMCLRAAAIVGLQAASTELVEVAGVSAIVSTRYDRQLVGGTWRRIHQEDLCQALSVHPRHKYQSDGGPGVGAIADLIRLRLGPEDRAITAEDFFRSLAFNVLIGGTDAHAKNYSFVIAGARARLAPLYDVASAAPYPQRERLSAPMKIADHWKMLDVSYRDWEKVGERLQIPADRAVAWVEELRASLPQAFADAAQALPDHTRPEAERQAGRVIEHVEGRWRPDLDR